MLDEQEIIAERYKSCRSLISHMKRSRTGRRKDMATVSVDSACSVHRPLASEDRQRNDLLTDQDVRYIVERKLHGNNFHILNWSIRELDQTSGYLGQYYNVRVTAKLDELDTKILSFFVKAPPPAKSPQNEFLFQHDTFNKEIIVYTDVLRQLGVGKGPKWSAECYLCKRNAIIVLEDAKLEGYATHDKYVPFDESHCARAIRTLSRFHSRCLIFDEKLRRTTGRTILDLYGHVLGEVLYAEDEKSRRGLVASVEGACTCIDLCQSLKDTEKEIMKKRVRAWSLFLPKLLGPSDKHRNVICHRDIWANNIMFKHDSNGSPVGCYLVDFQFACYCPPAIDAVFCLYLNTDRATRERHYESFLKLYHETLKRSLAEEGLDIEKCISWEGFRESCKMAKYIAIMYALTNLQIMLLSGAATEKYFLGAPEQLGEVLFGDKRSELVKHQYENVEPYRTRIDEITLEALEQLPDQPLFFLNR